MNPIQSFNSLPLQNQEYSQDVENSFIDFHNEENFLTSQQNLTEVLNFFKDPTRWKLIFETAPNLVSIFIQAEEQQRPLMAEAFEWLSSIQLLTEQNAKNLLDHKDQLASILAGFKTLNSENSNSCDPYWKKIIEQTPGLIQVLIEAKDHAPKIAAAFSKLYYPKKIDIHFITEENLKNLLNSIDQLELILEGFNILYYQLGPIKKTNQFNIIFIVGSMLIRAGRYAYEFATAVVFLNSHQCLTEENLELLFKYREAIAPISSSFLSVARSTAWKSGFLENPQIVPMLIKAQTNAPIITESLVKMYNSQLWQGKHDPLSAVLFNAEKLSPRSVKIFIDLNLKGVETPPNLLKLLLQVSEKAQEIAAAIETLQGSLKDNHIEELLEKKEDGKTLLDFFRMLSKIFGSNSFNAKEFQLITPFLIDNIKTDRKHLKCKIEALIKLKQNGFFSEKDTLYLIESRFLSNYLELSPNTANTEDEKKWEHKKKTVEINYKTEALIKLKQNGIFSEKDTLYLIESRFLSNYLELSTNTANTANTEDEKKWEHEEKMLELNYKTEALIKLKKSGFFSTEEAQALTARNVLFAYLDLPPNEELAQEDPNFKGTPTQIAAILVAQETIR